MKAMMISLLILFSVNTIAAPKTIIKDPELLDTFGKGNPIPYDTDLPMIMYHKFGQKYCATIHFMENETDYRMDYAFKPWNPDIKDKTCDFQNTDEVNVPVDQRAWCVKDHFENARQFTEDELEIVKNGNRSIELTSPVGDDVRFALSRCFNYQADGSNYENPLYVDLRKANAFRFDSTAPTPGNLDRSNPENVKVVSIELDKEYAPEYGPKDLTKKQSVLKIEMTNGFTYIIFADKNLK